jgi:carbonic anhydrase/acetyltransferase-like protein (isoleucine patch superfamily)
VSVRGGAAAYARMQSIHESVWIAPSAQVYGKVALGEGSSLWHNVVIRAECQSVRVGRVTNVQDFVMIHVGYDEPTTIGDFCSITHHAIVHGCTIGDATLVGPSAVIMDGAVVGPGSIVAAGAVVPEGKIFPAHSVIAGVPGKVIAQRDCARSNRMNAWLYERNARLTREGHHRAWEGPEFEAWRAARQAEVDEDRDLEQFLPLRS